MAHLFESNLIFFILALIFVGIVWMLTILACHKRNEMHPHNIAVEVNQMRLDYQKKLKACRDKANNKIEDAKRSKRTKRTN